MTTIAYKDGLLASDSRRTRGNHIVPGTLAKIARVGACLCGGAGYTTHLLKVFEALGADEDMPEWGDGESEAILVEADGSVWTYEGDGVWIPFDGEFIAIGSGSEYAYGAMAAGADAREAVKIAKRFDSMSGGPVRVLRLRKED